MDWREWLEKLICFVPSHHLRVPVERFKGVKIGEGTKIGQFTIFIGSRNLTIGKNCFIGKFCIIDALREPVTIGDNVTMAGRGSILSHGSRYMQRIGVKAGAIRIKKGAYIGHGVIILRNVTIGENAVIGAGTVITKDVQDHALVHPASMKVHTNG